jgi:hypothetical protein
MYVIYLQSSEGWLTGVSIVAAACGAGAISLQPNESVWAVPGTLDPTED